ncbi:acyl-CoA dehydrogenase family protein [Candidatus Solincola tengchongensis]|uniref:acyl-CoA dehydrogenase family protein n=1 Tax=Candidatus Solincola tengchongensis TaxID=2900693 RepID=UPI00257D238F|nr:acyl-CoA dehydrogenase family protein [Candidatus Solincola tengchongensis]
MNEVCAEDREKRLPPGVLKSADRMLAGSVRDFVDREVIPVRRELDQEARSGDYSKFGALLARLGELGLPGAIIPEEHGGEGLASFLPWCLVMEELGRGDASLAVCTAATALALRPAVLAGNGEVLASLAPRFLEAERGYSACPAFFEAPALGDELNPDLRGHGWRTRVEERGDGLFLTGNKAWCVNAGRAGVYCVAAFSGEVGEGGEPVLVYCDSPADGLEVTKRETTGLLSVPFGDLLLNGVRVPLSRRAAGAGEDAVLLREGLAFQRLLTAAVAVGIAQGAFEEVLAFTSERIAAGKPIRQHTVCAVMLADMAVGIQSGRDVYANAALLLDSLEVLADRASDSSLSRASIARAHCCRAAVEVTNRAMELMGSYGYVTDYHLEKYWRDAKMLQLAEVPAELLRLDVVRGYYRFDSLHPNPLYEEMARRRDRERSGV